MNSSDRRMKASDVYESSQPLLGKTTGFSAAFPGKESAAAVVEERDWDDPTYSRSSSFTERNFREYVDCRNPACYNGGVDVGYLLRTMTLSEQTDAEFDQSCQGYEGTPKGRRREGRCEHSFKVTIQVVYE